MEGFLKDELLFQWKFLWCGGGSLTKGHRVRGRGARCGESADTMIGLLLLDASTAAGKTPSSLATTGAACGAMASVLSYSKLVSMAVQ